MSNKQSESDKFKGNGSNTALFITKIKNSKQSDEDLRQLAEICFKSNVPITLFLSSKIKNSIADELLSSGKIQISNGNGLGDEIKNVCPVTLPLKTDPKPLCKWIVAANKIFDGDKAIAANGSFKKEDSLIEKYLGYWSNFWPKLFVGTNYNLSANEAIILPFELFDEWVINKKIDSAWQLAALAEKNKQINHFNFEYPTKSFVFGDGIKSLVSGKLDGFIAIYNFFLKTGNQKNKWTDINASIYKKSFGILATLLLVVMSWISYDYNITWDEPNHNRFSKDVLKYYTSFGNDTSMFDFTKQDYRTNVYYGMSIDVIAAGVNNTFGFKNEYTTRHFLNALVGFFGILFTALLVRLFSGWLPALVALLAMICSPSFFGHCFNNPKDIPFATGYIMALYYLLKMMKEMPNAKHQTKVMLAIGIGFALSIRAGGLLLFGFLLMGLGLQWLFFRNKKQKNSFSVAIKQLGVVAISGYLIGILMWPYALRAPLTGAITALREFEKFGFLTYYELFEGTRQYIKPWYYEIKLISLTAPIAILIGFFLSILGLIKTKKTETLMWLVLIVATLFPPVYAIIKNSYVYNGWRHFIFIYPSMLALSILGWYWLSKLFKKPLMQRVIMIAIAVTLIKPGIWSIVNHPYQYLYFNELAGGIQGANGNYEIDYWNQSPREAFKWLLENHPEIKSGDYKVNSNNIQESLKTFNPEGDSVTYAWTREYEWCNNDWSYAIWTSRTLSKNQILGGYWPPKGTIHEVKVDGVTVAAVVKSPNNYSNLAFKYLRKNIGDSALYFYQKCFEWNPLEEEYARGIGNACKMLKKYDSAIVFYNKAIALRDGNYDALLSLGDVYLTKAEIMNAINPDKELLNKAYDCYNLAYKNKINSPSPYYMGEISLLMDRPYEAKNNFNLYLKTYGNSANGYFGLARAQLKLNESDSALYNLEVAIQIEPKNPQPYYYLSTELQRLGRLKEAEQFLNEFKRLTGQPAQ